jgi:hypothetical protein
MWRRLAAHGIPNPARVAASRARPATEADPGALRAWRRPSPTCCPGWSTCRSRRACCWRTASRWRPSSSWRRSAPRGARWPGCGRRAMRWRTRCRTPSTNSTRTPGWCSSTPRTKPTWDNYLRGLAELRAAARPGQRLHDFYLRFFAHHLRAIAKPGGLFEDTTVTRLPWRGQVRRVRMVVYRRTGVAHRGAGSRPSRH